MVNSKSKQEDDGATDMGACYLLVHMQKSIYFSNLPNDVVRVS